MLDQNLLTEVIDTSEFVQGFFSGIFATEGILTVSSCIEAIQPIALVIDDAVHHADSTADYFEFIGEALVDTGKMVEICEAIPDSDKKEIKELFSVFGNPLRLVEDMTIHYFRNE